MSMFGEKDECILCPSHSLHTFVVCVTSESLGSREGVLELCHYENMCNYEFQFLIESGNLSESEAMVQPYEY